MNIVMIGTGYVGLVTGTCLAESGNDVTCVDIDTAKIDRLRRGDIPIYEPGLTDLVLRNVKSGRLKFSTSAAEVVPSAKCVFIAVGTPQGDDGAADLSGLKGVVETLAPLLPQDVIVVIKSTVPVGTNHKVTARLRELTGRDVDVVSNPEFLKEGYAIDDFTKPDRVVVGVSRPEVAAVMEELYKPFLRTDNPFLVMNPESAEMTKYVANCLLAAKISFINEMANLCDRVGADIDSVRRGIGHDQRIGFAFLFPGVGYGGSCFPKDVRALIHTAEEHQVEPQILKAIDSVNTAQKGVLYRKICEHFGGNLQGHAIAVWGVSFKPRTDDIREAPALVLIDQLLAAGATAQVHDPVALANLRIYSENKYGRDPDRLKRLVLCEQQYDAVEKSDALVIVTEWSEFRTPNFDTLKRKLRNPVIFDGRNLYDPVKTRERGFVYYGIGRGLAVAGSRGEVSVMSLGGSGR